jgi:phosphoglucomutase
MDTHALSEPSRRTALEVLAACGVEVMVQADLGFTPTPVISHAILQYNRGRRDGLADGIVITPSHNPPEDGGIKYNPPEGGPAGPEITVWIENRANELMAAGLGEAARIPYERALAASTTHRHDFIGSYTADLGAVVDMEIVRAAGLRMGVDPLGGASVAYWEPIAERYWPETTGGGQSGKWIPPFRSCLWTGTGGSAWTAPPSHAMAGLIGLRPLRTSPSATIRTATGTGSSPPEGLMNPNHFLPPPSGTLFSHRRAGGPMPLWKDPWSAAP